MREFQVVATFLLLCFTVSRCDAQMNISVTRAFAPRKSSMDEANDSDGGGGDGSGREEKRASERMF